uniref:Uncharacterized protein n=1 Tax=Anguilla anguilla TaxID=7936 RepID=A0A0E9Q7M8_ANGAN
MTLSVPEKRVVKP